MESIGNIVIRLQEVALAKLTTQSQLKLQASRSIRLRVAKMGTKIKNATGARADEATTVTVKITLVPASTSSSGRATK